MRVAGPDARFGTSILILPLQLSLPMVKLDNIRIWHSWIPFPAR
jgi:hypothetical protein